MKRGFRLMLVVAALAAGGWLGWILLVDFEPLKLLGFFAACGVLGVVFHRIDQSIFKE